MSTTTASKKELVDFLWEWASTHGQWGMLLVDKIVRAEAKLTPSERVEVFDYFLQSVGLKSGLPAIALTKPTYAPPAKKVELTTLSDIKGVNRLADGQVINFSPTLTVVYGDNGTGKTGYGRILKSLGICYEPPTKIYPNIFNPGNAQSATVKYKAGGKDETFTWNGSNSNSDLKSISVFNNNCVSISLSGSRGLIVSPIGFHLFGLLSSELNELESLLNNEVTKRPVSLQWAQMLNIGTPQSIFIGSLGKDSKKEHLDALSSFSDKNQDEFDALQLELKNLNRTLLETETKLISAQIAELDGTLVKIDMIAKTWNSTNWQSLSELQRGITELEKKAQVGLSQVAEERGIELYNSPQFATFIKAADDYIRLLDNKDYPDGDGEVCVYCRQSLTDERATELLKRYRALLNDTTQEELTKSKSQRDALLRQMMQADCVLKFHQATFGLDEKQQPIQPDLVKGFNDVFVGFKEKLKNADVSEAFTLNYGDIKNALTRTKGELKAQHDAKTLALNNLSAREKSINERLNELKDRKLFSEKLDEVVAAIENHKVVSILSKNRSGFNTSGLSRKTTEARESLLSQNFKTLFEGELKLLRKSQIAVELNFGTSRGQSQVSQTLRSHSLQEILSEGEQKAIALAEFLTELQLDNASAPVVFDDPVNSLDHKIIDDFSKRLLKLSATRQTIVFTHSILLFNSLIQQSQLTTYKSLKPAFFNSKNNTDSTGVIEDAIEMNSYTYFEKKINTLLGTKPGSVTEADLAGDGYGYLRSAIELTVEKEILQDTVKRYRRNVALTSFLKVNGEALDKCKTELNELFERCSGYLKGHSNPEEVHNDPSLAELKTDFDAFKVIRRSFTNPN